MSDTAKDINAMPPEFHKEFCFSYSFDVGTAPFNEITAQHTPDHGQRDPNEATDPDSLSYRARAIEEGDDGTPNGFRWGEDGNGQPILKPMQASIDALAELAKLNFYEYKDDRDSGMPRDKDLFYSLKKILHSLKAAQAVEALRDLNDAFFEHPNAGDFTASMDRAQARINKVNEFVGNSFARAIMRQAEADFCTAVYWLHIHKTNMLRHQENGNERAVEECLIKAESSRAQMLICGQILDWARELNFEIDLERGAKSALGRKGWTDTQKLLNTGKQPKPRKEEFLQGVNW
jgi:hypothetical protein